jgi:hypothetical protein
MLAKQTQDAAYDETGFDAHGIEPVPAAHRTSSPFDRFWIWTGANIAPINWVLGALGIQLGLSLLQTLAVVLIGNLFGAALFAAFCLMGHRTGVPQMVLGRLAFGRRGAYLPALAQVLMPMGWVAINTWIVLDLCMAALERMGFSGGPEIKYMIAALVMVLQVGIAAWGFNAIKVFERHTMPVILFITAVMTALAFLRVDIKWQSPHGGVRGGHAVDDRDRHRLGYLMAHLCLGLHALHQALARRRQGAPGDIPRHVPADGLARLPGRGDRVRRRGLRSVETDHRRLRRDGAAGASRAAARPDRDQHRRHLLGRAVEPQD